MNSIDLKLLLVNPPVKYQQKTIARLGAHKMQTTDNLVSRLQALTWYTCSTPRHNTIYI